MYTLAEKARVFAQAAHAAVGQTRKYTGEPYINHCKRACDILIAHQTTPPSVEQLAATWLHDTVEDTQVTLELIEQVFGTQVAEWVSWLTDVSKPEDGVRRVRKALDRDHTAAAPLLAKNCKLADLIDNARDITTHDPGFARVWLKEKAALLEVLSDADPTLYALAQQVYADSIAKLKENH